MNNVNSDGIIIIGPLNVNDANTISSPFTHGFPSMSGFLGYIGNLNRKLKEKNINLHISGVGVICHNHQELVSADEYGNKYFNITKNPLDKNGKNPSIVVEGRINLKITLVGLINWTGSDDENIFYKDEPELNLIENDISNIILGMRVVGGSVSTKTNKIVQLLSLPEDIHARTVQFRNLRSKWVGNILVSRSDLLESRLEELRLYDKQVTSYDALMDLCRVNWKSREEKIKHKNGKEEIIVHWEHDHPIGSGWIVPIPIGYNPLTPLLDTDIVSGTRDDYTPVRFVEVLLSIGQWINPRKLVDINQLIWYTTSNDEAYLYKNDYINYI